MANMLEESCKHMIDNMLSLNALRDEIYEDAVEHGLWEDFDTVRAGVSEFCKSYPEYAFDLDAADRRECAAYIRKECDELRDASDIKHYAEELADVIIMSLSVAGKLGIDIDAAVRRKMAVNKERPWKHGKE